MPHQLIQNDRVIEAGKDVMEPVFNSFLALNSMVYLNPFEKYALNRSTLKGYARPRNQLVE